MNYGVPGSPVMCGQRTSQQSKPGSWTAQALRSLHLCPGGTRPRISGVYYNQSEDKTYYCKGTCARPRLRRQPAMKYGSALPMGWRERQWVDADVVALAAQCDDDRAYHAKFMGVGAALGMMAGVGWPRKPHRGRVADAPFLHTVDFAVGMLTGMVAAVGVSYLLRPTRQECKL